MRRTLQGKYITISTAGEKVQAFIPDPLPPNPPIDWSPELRTKYDEVARILGRLDAVSDWLPNIPLYLYMYIRKEALLSSMIEGTQSSLSDLLLYEIKHEPGVPMEDVQEVSNYVAALNHGLELVKDGFPISLRLMREVHGVMLDHGRGSKKTPGEFRRSQNWIGGTRPGNAFFVPPPADHLMECLGKLELFLNDQPHTTSPIVKAALGHVQFETIHPFLDGNGRVGRLLITLLLCSQKVLRQPLLYLSLYFKTHRMHYYRLLNTVRQNGDWEAWLDFFADAVIVTANQAIDTAKLIHQLIESHRVRIMNMGRKAESTLKVQKALLIQPLVSSIYLVKKTGLTSATVNKALDNLINLGILTELTSQKRNRLFLYTEYYQIMSKGTELPE